MTGKVKAWKNTFGFIKPDNGAKDIFVHFSGIVATDDGFRELEAGQHVEFDVAESERGAVATNVKIIEVPCA